MFLDYFLSGYVKGIVYFELPTSRDNMIARIITKIITTWKYSIKETKISSESFEILKDQNFEHLL